MSSPISGIEDIIYLKYTSGNVFEWGGSEISKHYSRFSKSWKCVTYDKELFDDIRNSSNNIDIILKEPNFKYSKFEPALSGQFIDYVNSINSSQDKYDSIIIHGRDRLNCAKEAVKHLSEDGVIIVYDFWNRLRYHRLLEDFDIVDGFNDGRSSHTVVVLKPKATRKKILIYTGYSSRPWNSGSIYESAIGGSELATVRVSKELVKIGYDVVVSGYVKNGVGEDGVRYLQSGDQLQEYLDRNKLDVIIVSRYLHFVSQYSFNSDQLYLLLHDLVHLPWGINKSAPQTWETQSKYSDIIHLNHVKSGKFDGIICLTDWHRRNYEAVFPYTRGKIYVWGNAINPESFNEPSSNKIKNSFIWVSRAVRGLGRLLDMWPEIKQRIPDATLNVYTYNTQGEGEVISRCKKLDGVTHHGGVPQSVLLDRIQETEYWFYPTNFSETYCITALEMQYSRVTCVCTRLAALTNTVDDRGVLFDIPSSGYESDEYKKEALDAFFSVYENQENRNALLDKAYEWATEQTWSNRALELDNYFKSIAKNKYNSKWKD
jgi:glycosyltransferase involved in cell wall biosynthesis